MGIEKRDQPRIPITAEALLAVLVPDETFSPNYVRGVATDISLSGVRVKSYQLTREDYHRLIRGVNFAKLNLTLPYVEEPVELRARIVWVEFHDRKAGDPPHCVLGLKFERLGQAATVRLQYVLNRLGADSYETVRMIDPT